MHDSLCMLIIYLLWLRLLLNMSPGFGLWHFWICSFCNRTKNPKSNTTAVFSVYPCVVFGGGGGYAGSLRVRGKSENKWKRDRGREGAREEGRWSGWGEGTRETALAAQWEDYPEPGGWSGSPDWRKCAGGAEQPQQAAAAAATRLGPSNRTSCSITDSQWRGRGERRFQRGDKVSSAAINLRADSSGEKMSLSVCIEPVWRGWGRFNRGFTKLCLFQQLWLTKGDGKNPGARCSLKR